MGSELGRQVHWRQVRRAADAGAAGRTVTSVKASRTLRCPWGEARVPPPDAPGNGRRHQALLVSVPSASVLPPKQTGCVREPEPEPCFSLSLCPCPRLPGRSLLVTPSRFSEQTSKQVNP